MRSSTIVILIIAVIVVVGFFWWGAWATHNTETEHTVSTVPPTASDTQHIPTNTPDTAEESSADTDGQRVETRTWESYESEDSTFTMLHPKDATISKEGTATVFTIEANGESGSLFIRPRTLAENQTFQDYVTALMSQNDAKQGTMLKPVTVSDVDGNIVISFAFGTEDVATNYLIFPQGEDAFLEIEYDVSRDATHIAPLFSAMIDTLDVKGGLKTDALEDVLPGATSTQGQNR